MTPIDLVADESVDAGIINALRLAGYAVWSVSEETPSVSDDIVLAAAFEKSVVLLTEDKDFGELAIRLKKPHCGILLIRLAGFKSDQKAAIVVKAMQQHFSEFKNAFSVLDQLKIRIKML